MTGLGRTGKSQGTHNGHILQANHESKVPCFWHTGDLGSALAIIMPGRCPLCPPGSCWHPERRCLLPNEPLCARVLCDRNGTEKEEWSLLSGKATPSPGALLRSVSWLLPAHAGSSETLLGARNKCPGSAPAAAANANSSWCHQEPQTKQGDPPWPHPARQQLTWGSAQVQSQPNKAQRLRLLMPCWKLVARWQPAGCKHGGKAELHS